MADAALLPGARAGRELVARDPVVDCLYVLSLVVWPTEELAREPSVRRVRVSADELARIREVAADGLTHYAIAERVSRPRSTVTEALRQGA